MTLTDRAIKALSEDMSLMDVPIKQLDEMSKELTGKQISYGTWDRAKKKIRG